MNRVAKYILTSKREGGAVKRSRYLVVLFSAVMLLTGCVSVTVGPPGHVVGFVYIPGPDYVREAGMQEVLFSAEREPPRGYVPLIGADVRIRGKLDLTDGDGRFEIRNIQPGTHTLTVSHELLRTPIKKAVRIESDRVTWLGRYEEGPLFGGVGYYIMIGIDYYPSLGQGEREAPGAADNARRVYDALFEQNGLAAFGMLLTNRNAEKADIQDAIEEAVEKALLDPVTRTSDDYLVIYFSGKSGQDYLVPYDSAGSGWADEITDYDLERWLRQFPGSVTVIIDGTESATMADGHILRPLALAKRKYTVLSAAGRNEQIFYDKNLRSSVFTYYLLEGISGRYPADPNRDGDISARELYNYIYREMKSHFRGWQDPDSHEPGFYGGEHEHTVVFRY